MGKVPDYSVVTSKKKKNYISLSVIHVFKMKCCGPWLNRTMPQ
jgi:hypothetical protein